MKVSLSRRMGNEIKTFYFSKVQKNKSTRIIFPLTIILMAVLIAIWFMKVDHSPLSILLENKNEVIASADYVVRIQTNAMHIDVIVNGITIKSFICLANKFEHSFNLTSREIFHEGWNYVQFRGTRLFSNDSLITGGAINIIDGGPDVFVPDINLYDARRWNRELHQDAGYYEAFFFGYDYKWNGKALDGLIYSETDYLQFDKENDVPMVQYKDVFYYNPVTIAQNGLGWYNQFLITHDKADLAHFINTADFFSMSTMDNGSFPYTIPFALKTNIVLPAGFISGMAQGQILSVLIRAWDVTNDYKYLEAGNRVLGFTLNTVDNNVFDGSRKTIGDFTKLSNEMTGFSNLRILEEYVTIPSSYVMNGDMIGMLGLNDWAMGAPKEYGSDLALEAFDECVDAMKVLLPYYDYYGWTSYDLLQYTYDSFPLFSSNYAHRVYIEHLHAFYLITGDEELRIWRDIFYNYEVDEFWRQSNTIYQQIA